MSKLKIEDMWGLDPSLKFFTNKRNKFADLYKGEKIILNSIIDNKLSVLDYGCATGGMYKILKKKIRKLNYVGVDFNERLLDKARILNPGVKFFSTKEYKKKLKNKKFDVVLILGLLHLNSDWKKIITENSKYSKKYLIFDLRETEKKGVENILKSNFNMQFDSSEKKYRNYKIPYNIINSLKVQKILDKKLIKFKKFIEIKYEGEPSAKSKTLYRNVIFANYCYKK